MKKTTEMNIGLSKEELENLPPSEKHIVLNSLQDVKRNADLVDEYLTEASHGESDETMSITCGDFFQGRGILPGQPLHRLLPAILP